MDTIMFTPEFKLGGFTELVSCANKRYDLKWDQDTIRALSVSGPYDASVAPVFAGAHTSRSGGTRLIRGGRAELLDLPMGN